MSSLLGPTRLARRPPLGCEPLEDRTLPSAGWLTGLNDPAGPSLDETRPPVLVSEDGAGHLTLRTGVEVGGISLEVTIQVNVPAGTTGREALVGALRRTFAPGPQTGPRPSLAVGDLKGDGRDELVVADPEHDRVSVRGEEGEKEVVAAKGLAPRAVYLADLRGTGLLDLVVVCDGTNSVLVYPGLGDGWFGPEVNGGKGFAVGTNPADVAIADLTGDGTLDLVVANEGSDDVSVLYGRGRGADWTLVQGPRLPAGSRPTSVLVTDASGHGTRDLVVTDSGSDRVEVLRALGGGAFDVTVPRILPTGAAPRMSVVGDFDGKPDLVVVDSGSDDLTFFSDFRNPASVGRTISSGGKGPVAAVAETGPGGGPAFLVVVNDGSGTMAVLVSSADGPRLAAILAAPGPQPVAVTAAADGSGVYVTDASSSATAVLTIDTTPPTAGAGGANPGATAEPAGSAAGPAGSAAGPVPTYDGEADSGAQRPDAHDLQPLPGGAVAVVPTVVAAGAPHEPTHPAGAALAVPLAWFPACASAEAKGAGTENAPPAPPPPEPGGTSASVSRFVQGVDEAVRASRRPARAAEPRDVDLALPGAHGPAGAAWAEEGHEEAGPPGMGRRGPLPAEAVLDAVFSSERGPVSRDGGEEDCGEMALAAGAVLAAVIQPGRDSREASRPRGGRLARPRDA
jgi:hypothetical protein